MVLATDASAIVIVSDCNIQVRKLIPACSIDDPQDSKLGDVSVEGDELYNSEL